MALDTSQTMVGIISPSLVQQLYESFDTSAMYRYSRNHTSSDTNLSNCMKSFMIVMTTSVARQQRL